jgi:hypothetical protein
VGLLLDIQTAVLENSSDIAPILLKLRLVAARLGSQQLADWIKFESEGYPSDVTVPDYRVLGVSYRGTFSGPFNSGINNAPIPSYLIEKFGGKHWTRFNMRQSIASVDELLSSGKEGGSLSIDSSNLTLLLQGKVYPDYTCNEIAGTISLSQLAAIRHVVLSRILELTIELEKSVPEASTVSIREQSSLPVSSAQATTQIAQQIIYGNYTSVSAGHGSSIAVAVGERDAGGLATYLEASGIDASDARALAELASTEEPESKAEPMGPKVKGWLVENLKKAGSGAWKVGIAVATDVIKEGLLKYYGLK